jgi:hypothetical protein
MFEDLESIASGQNKNYNSSNGSSYIKSQGVKLDENIRNPGVKFVDTKYEGDELYLKYEFYSFCSSVRDKHMKQMNQLYKNYRWVKYSNLKFVFYGNC